MSCSRNKEGDSVAGAGWVKNQCGTSGKGVQRGKGWGAGSVAWAEEAAGRAWFSL